MDELFSCRNCVHNSGQSLNIGRGLGYCLHHSSIIREPARTTCKYLHRKDLPWFVVNEGRSEHAAEFAEFGGLVDLNTHQPLKSAFYSERVAWENSEFDAITNALARYHQSSPKWIFIESFTSGVDGRRALAQSSLTRRYMAHCDTWRSSFRLTLDVVQQLPNKPYFLQKDIWELGHMEEAVWDVLFSRISLVQEYGWHAGIPLMTWMTDNILNLQEFIWDSISEQLEHCAYEIIQEMFRHARDNDAYFSLSSPQHQQEESESFS